MSLSELDLIRHYSNELVPRATSTESRHQLLDGIQAVMFDIYGTLVISASGDVDAASSSDRPRALAEAIQDVPLDLEIDPADGVDCFTDCIARAHSVAKESGVEYPEIDIREIWRETLAQLDARCTDSEIERLAIAYEVRVNPVWPMPNLRNTLADLRHRNLTLGLISNAQFVTPQIFPALVGGSLTDLGFAADLRFYSFEMRRAKPGVELYLRAKDVLQSRQIDPDQVLYVGNDLLKDVMPAQRIGFRTALFAGDQRSLRWREGDSRVAGVAPDLIIKDLSELIVCLA